MPGRRVQRRQGPLERLDLWIGIVRVKFIAMVDEPVKQIDLAARRSGMTTMVDDAVDKCRGGDTSTAEVLRVTTIR